ncbi:hypothetical protein IG631_10374 [Alternaria alternata]|nr:hypothetical protein IG631_10374 [Alternaria alternata]
MLLCSNLFLPSGLFEPDQPRHMSTTNRAVRIETGGVVDQQDNEHMISNDTSSLGIDTHLSKYGPALIVNCGAKDAKIEVQCTFGIWKPGWRSVLAANGARGFRLAQRRHRTQLHFKDTKPCIATQGLPGYE